MFERHALTDAQWARIEHLLPGCPGSPGARAQSNRHFVNAVLWRYRTGSPWRDLPAHFGHFRLVHTRHSRWCRTGVWQRLFAALAQEADNEWVMIDSSIVRAHQHSAGAAHSSQHQQAIGRSRGGLSTKIHTTVDALGNPTGFVLTPGQVHDVQGAEPLLEHLQGSVLIADKAYGAHKRLIEPLQTRGNTVVIPPKVNAKNPRAYDKHLYKARHLIENFFAKLKQYRAIATRYDKTARNFLGAIHLAASVIWLA